MFRKIIVSITVGLVLASVVLWLDALMHGYFFTDMQHIWYFGAVLVIASISSYILLPEEKKKVLLLLLVIWACFLPLGYDRSIKKQEPIEMKLVEPSAVSPDSFQITKSVAFQVGKDKLEVTLSRASNSASEKKKLYEDIKSSKPEDFLLTFIGDELLEVKFKGKVIWRP